MKNWSLDLGERQSLAELHINKVTLFLNGGDKIEGRDQMIARLRAEFGENLLLFEPTFKELSAQFGYEFGDLCMRKYQSLNIINYQYSIVWTLVSGQWKILSYTIISTQTLAI